ncbi:hypothetical protein N780_14310 [Pontibacillus chungwhensis BH030062]|uniref:Uncharacterized protein n=1 Tax=Pontibacillus chungwhensis BH030062 TaxID=1385513 RepID=A0A0A2V134_9BACI|nr:hypothetical protein N780_14310 [Pontibacillus chungwhensis BH030062]
MGSGGWSSGGAAQDGQWRLEFWRSGSRWGVAAQDLAERLKMGESGSRWGKAAQVHSIPAQNFFRTAQVQKITTQDEPKRLKLSYMGSNTRIMAQVNRKPAQAERCITLNRLHQGKWCKLGDLLILSSMRTSVNFRVQYNRYS